MNYGTYIRKVREDLKENQIAFAKRLDLTQPYLCQVEQNKKKPSLKVLERVAAIAQVSMSQMFMSLEAEEVKNTDAINA